MLKKNAINNKYSFIITRKYQIFSNCTTIAIIIYVFIAKTPKSKQIKDTFFKCQKNIKNICFITTGGNIFFITRNVQSMSIIVYI